MSTVKEMTVGFPEWTGIYILIYSQTRNAVGRGLLFKDVFRKTDINKLVLEICV